jgi:hypothetical protein
MSAGGRGFGVDGGDGTCEAGGEGLDGGGEGLDGGFDMPASR